MTSLPLPASFIDTVAAVQKVLDAFAQQGVIIGGVAASLLGKPRTTADVDAVILLATDDLPQLITIAAREGLLPRTDNAEAFARRHRVLLLQHNATGIGVDISLGVLPFEIETVERSQVVQIENIEIRLPTPEDLIIQKAVAHRPKDLSDIATIIDSQSNLDWDRIQFWVQQFAEALEMPELWQDIAKMRPSRKRPK